MLSLLDLFFVYDHRISVFWAWTRRRLLWLGVLYLSGLHRSRRVPRKMKTLILWSCWDIMTPKTTRGSCGSTTSRTTEASYRPWSSWRGRRRWRLEEWWETKWKTFNSSWWFFICGWNYKFRVRKDMMRSVTLVSCFHLFPVFMLC